MVAPEPYPSPPFQARGAVSELILLALQHPESDADALLGRLPEVIATGLAEAADVIRDDDLQLALFVLYGLHYGGVVDTDEEWEWNPGLLAGRRTIEREFERRLREVVPRPTPPKADAEAVAAALFELTGRDDGPSLSRYAAKKATLDQLIEIIVQRSAYTLKEADAHTWAIPRLRGRAKSALVEIQADEYGGGRPARMHSTIFAGTMRGVGLDDRYGTYIDNIPAITLASFTMMTMFGLNRSLRGASAGHLAAFEMTSSIPCRLYGNGFRRLGFGEEVTWYFDEHVEADAVHEQIAGRDLAGGLAEDEPGLLEDILFGASACLTVDGWVAQHILEEWMAGRSSLRLPLADATHGAV